MHNTCVFCFEIILLIRWGYQFWYIDQRCILDMGPVLHQLSEWYWVDWTGQKCTSVHVSIFKEKNEW